MHSYRDFYNHWRGRGWQYCIPLALLYQHTSVKLFPVLLKYSNQKPKESYRRHLGVVYYINYGSTQIQYFYDANFSYKYSCCCSLKSILGQTVCNLFRLGKGVHARASGEDPRREKRGRQPGKTFFVPLPSRALNHTRGHFRVSRVLRDRLRKTRGCFQSNTRLSVGRGYIVMIDYFFVERPSIWIKNQSLRAKLCCYCCCFFSSQKEC